MRSEPRKTGRRTFLVLGVSAALAGCTQASSGGNSGTSTTMRDEEPTSGSPAPTTTPDRTSTGSSKPTATSKATTPETTTTGETERDGTDADSVEINSNETFPQTTARVTDSDPSTDGSATILVWNDAETTRRIRAAITERNSGVSVFRKTYPVEADAYIEIELTKPGKYTLGVGSDDGESATIEFFVDTCNSERITVAIRGDGTVNWEWLSTAVGCR